MKKFSNRLGKKNGRGLKGKAVNRPKVNRLSFETLEKRQLLAVATTYQFDTQQLLDVSFGESEAAATSLVNNGMATVASDASFPGFSDQDIFSTNLKNGWNVVCHGDKHLDRSIGGWKFGNRRTKFRNEFDSCDAHDEFRGFYFNDGSR